MSRTHAGWRRIAALFFAFGLILATSGSAFAHARFDRAEPPIDAPLDGAPVVLKTYYSQELTSKSTVRVLDANGVQVDLGDGHVDLDDPIRKTMLVSLPALPEGVYTISYVADSAEDGHAYEGTAAFGVGMAPPSAAQPAAQPAMQPAAGPEVNPVGPEGDPAGMSPDAARPLSY